MSDAWATDASGRPDRLPACGRGRVVLQHRNGAIAFSPMWCRSWSCPSCCARRADDLIRHAESTWADLTCLHYAALPDDQKARERVNKRVQRRDANYLAVRAAPVRHIFTDVADVLDDGRRIRADKALQFLRSDILVPGAKRVDWSTAWRPPPRPDPVAHLIDLCEAGEVDEVLELIAKLAARRGIQWHDPSQAPPRGVSAIVAGELAREAVSLVRH